MERGGSITLIFLLCSFLIIILPLTQAQSCGCGCSAGGGFSAYKLDYMGNFCDLHGLNCAPGFDSIYDNLNTYLQPLADAKYNLASSYCKTIKEKVLYPYVSGMHCAHGTPGMPVGCGNGQDCCGGNCYDSDTQYCCEDLSGHVCNFIFNKSSGMRIGKESCVDANGDDKTDSCSSSESLSGCTPQTCKICKSAPSTPIKYISGVYDFMGALIRNTFVTTSSVKETLDNAPNGTSCTISYPGDGSEDGACYGGKCVINKTIQVSMGKGGMPVQGNKPNSPEYYLNELGENEGVGCSASVNQFNKARGDEITEIKLVSDSGVYQSLKGFEETYFSGGIIFSVTFDNNGNMPRGKKVWCEATATLGGATKTGKSEVHVFVERNIKDESKYPESSAFVVSSDGSNGLFDWRSILSSVPAVMWKNSSKDKWCQKLTGFDSLGNATELEKCGYPLLISQQGSGVFGKKQPDDININEYFIGDFFKENPQLKIQNINPDKLKDMWKEAGIVVLSDYNDYKKGLILSEEAAYLNAPLVFAGSENQAEWKDYLKNKLIIMDSSFNESFQGKEIYENLLKYNIIRTVDFSQLLNGYSYLNGYGYAYKTVIVNPYDINKTYCEINEADKQQDYCGMSLLAPVLGFGRDMSINFIEASSAPGYVEMTKKQEEIDAAGDDQIENLEKQLEVMEAEVKSSAESIHGSIWNMLKGSGIGIKEALILSAPKAIPTYSPQFDFPFYKYYFDGDGVLNPDCCDCTPAPNIDNSRMYAKNPSDISGYIAGDLFGLPKCSCTGDICSLGSSAKTEISSSSNKISKPFLNYLAGYVNDLRGYSSSFQPNERMSSEEFEKFLAEQDLTKIGGMPQEDIISCTFTSSKKYMKSAFWGSYDDVYPTLDNQKMAVAHYYSLIFRLKNELMLNLAGIATGDFLTNKLPYLDGVSINETVASVAPDVQAKYEEVKNYPVNAQNFDSVNMGRLVDETVNILPSVGLYDALLAQNNEDLKINGDILSSVLRMPIGSGDFSTFEKRKNKLLDERTKISDRINLVGYQKRLITSVYYWVEGQKFKEVVGSPDISNDKVTLWLYNTGNYRALYGGNPAIETQARERVKQAITSQINENRLVAVKRINDVQDALVCMHTKEDSYNSCYEKIDNMLAGTQMPYPKFNVPARDFTKYPDTGYLDIDNINTRLISNGYLIENQGKYHLLISDRKFNAVVFDTSIMIFAVVLSAVPGMLPVTALKLQALARMGVALAGAINAAYIIRGVDDAILACRDVTIGTADDLQPDVNDKIRADIGVTALKDYTGCVVSIAMNIPVAVSGVYVTSRIVKTNIIPNIAAKFRDKFPAIEKKLNDMGDRIRLFNKDQRGSTFPGEYPGGGCFLPGTKIMMADGSEKNIEDIKKGENVEAYDISKNITVQASVTETFVRESDGYYVINYEVEN